MTERRFVIRLVGALAILWTAAAVAQTAADCTRNPDQTLWFVRAGASGETAGTNDRPFGSLADVERCSPAGATITVLAPPDGAPPLDGGIRLKDRQKLIGPATPAGATPAARITNTSGSGDAVTLAHGNEVAHLHIDDVAGAAIFGDNVNGTHLHDLLLTRRAAAAPTAVSAAQCRIVKAADAVDMNQSVLRGCGGTQVGGAKSAVTLLVDDAVGVGSVKYSIQRVAVRGNPAREGLRSVWPTGVLISR